MAVDNKSEQYEKYAPIWQKMRDVVEGQDAIHKASEKYLPKLDLQSDKDYKNYKERALFYNATGRTIKGLSGMVFMKDPTFSEMPDNLQELTSDIDNKGSPLKTFSKSVVDELLTITRCGILVDHAQSIVNEDGTEVTIAEAEAMNSRPYMSMYKGESIINWRVEHRNNRMIVTLVVLEETVDKLSDDEFTWETNKQYRVLDLDEDGNYRQRIFTPSGTGFDEGDPVYPVVNGVKKKTIPFIFINSEDLGTDIEKPIFKDLADVNISHYQTVASHEHGIFWIGLPTPVVTGATSQTDDQGNVIPLTLGPSEFLTFGNENANAFFMELEGKGLDHVEKSIDKKEGRMAALGARMLQPEKAAPETAQALSIKRGGEIGALATIAGTASEGITKALKLMAEWMQIEKYNELTYILNQDYVSSSMTAQEITALMAAWQSGSISHGDYIHALQRGEVIRPDRKSEDILDDVAEEGTALALVE